jgi:hypothetical protein
MWSHRGSIPDNNVQNRGTVKECRGTMKTLRVKYIRNNATANLLKSETRRWNANSFSGRFEDKKEKSTYPRPRIPGS